MLEGCPIQPPKLLRADSLVETCASCGAWVDRYPEFLGESDGFWQCDKCDNTSIKIRQGRPYSRRSRQWQNIVTQFEELFTDIAPQDWDSVICEPPLASLDWNAIEAWYVSHNIYRIFINVGVVEVTQS